jgi:hypothetical protein
MLLPRAFLRRRHDESLRWIFVGPGRRARWSRQLIFAQRRFGNQHGGWWRNLNATRERTESRGASARVFAS